MTNKWDPTLFYDNPTKNQMLWFIEHIRRFIITHKYRVRKYVLSSTMTRSDFINKPWITNNSDPNEPSKGNKPLANMDRKYLSFSIAFRMGIWYENGVHVEFHLGLPQGCLVGISETHATYMVCNLQIKSHQVTILDGKTVLWKNQDPLAAGFFLVSVRA